MTRKEKITNWIDEFQIKHNFNLAWFIRYAVGGTVTAVVEWAVYFAIAWYNYLAATAISNLVSYIVNYLLSKYWVFRSPETKHIRDATLFVVSSAINLVVVTFVTKFLVEEIGLHKILGKIGASVVAFVIVLIFKRFIIWSDTSKY
ncbi:MAG: GtrA family protein [Clostridia bacterium]